MTIKRHRPVALETRPWVPVEVSYDETSIYLGEPATEWDGWDFDLALDDFCRLAVAQPEEMAEFISATSVPELCQHGRPRWHDDRKGSEPCRMAEDDGVPAVRVRHLRDAARGLAALRSIGASLRARQGGDVQAWRDLLRWTAVILGDRDAITSGDWRRQRPMLASLVERLLRESGVVPVFTWEDSTSLVLAAHETLGGMVLMVAREIGTREEYLCNHCGTELTPKRPPRPGEGVYCERKACKNARDAAASRAYRERKRQEEGR